METVLSCNHPHNTHRLIEGGNIMLVWWSIIVIICRLAWEGIQGAIRMAEWDATHGNNKWSSVVSETQLNKRKTAPNFRLEFSPCNDSPWPSLAELGAVFVVNSKETHIPFIPCGASHWKHHIFLCTKVHGNNFPCLFCAFFTAFHEYMFFFLTFPDSHIIICDVLFLTSL